MLYKLVLYGAGKRCKKLCFFLKDSSYEIVAILDSNPQKWGDCVEGFVVEPPEKLRLLDDVGVCITVADERESESIRRELQHNYQYDIAKEICFNTLIFEIYKEHPIIKQKILQKREQQKRSRAVLFDCYDNGLGLGGIEAWTIDICSALIQDGRQNVYIMSCKGTFNIPSLIDNHVIYVNRDGRDIFAFESIICLIEAIMDKLPCTVVTAHVDAVMWAAYIIKHFYPDKIKIVSVVHEGNEKTYDRYFNFRECTDIYVGVSEDIKNALIERGIIPEKVYDMACPFACEKMLARSYTEDKHEPIRIGYAGRLCNLEGSPKRMDLILKLAETLMEEKVDFMMELAGDGPGRREMEKYINSRNLAVRVKFLGRLERQELSSFWKRQDICINVSDSEGRCISRLEAMANGAVPVVTNTSGTKEDITDGVNGFVVSIGDYNTMTGKIMYLAEHRERLPEMGKLAHDGVYPKSKMEPHLEFWKNIL